MLGYLSYTSVASHHTTYCTHAFYTQVITNVRVVWNVTREITVTRSLVPVVVVDRIVMTFVPHRNRTLNVTRNLPTLWATMIMPRVHWDFVKVTATMIVTVK